MQELANFIGAIAGLIVALTAAYKAFTNFKQKNHENQEEDHDELEHDAELYRRRWLDAEKGNDELRRKIKRLRKENKNDDK